MRNILVTKAMSLIPFHLRERVKAIPGIAALQRAIVSLTLDGHEFEHLVDAGPAKGIKFLVQMPEDKGIWTGAYEINFATQVATNVRPGMVAYDIGSWHGFFAGVMAANGAREVHVFEPLGVNAVRIRKLVRLNPGKIIVVHEYAVGDQDTEMDLVVMSQTSMAKLEVSSFQSQVPGAQHQRVKVRCIDRLVANGEVPPPNIMKIDVEGAEVMVLSGALETIRHHRPVIFAEVHSSLLLLQCRQFFESVGYRQEIIFGNDSNRLSGDIFQIKATRSSSMSTS